MKSLDYYFQFILIILNALCLMISAFINDLIIFFGVLLFILGSYQVLHYIIYVASKLIAKARIHTYLKVYPIVVTCYFLIWYYLISDSNDFFIIGWMILALPMGMYYFYHVHKKNLSKRFRIY